MNNLKFAYSLNFINISFGFLWIYLIANNFDLVILGQLALSLTLISLFQILFSARVLDVFFKLYERYGIQYSSFLLKTSFFIEFSLSLVAITIFFFIGNTMIIFFDLPLEIYYFILILILLGHQTVFTTYLNYFEKYKLLYFFELLETVLKSVILYLIINIYNIQNISDTEKVFYIVLLCKIFIYVLNICMSYYFMKKNRVNQRINIPKKHKKLILGKVYVRFKKTFLINLFKVMNQRMDNLIISKFIGFEILAIYEITKKILIPIQFIVKPFNILFAKKITLLEKEKKHTLSFNFIMSTSSKIFLVILPLIFLELLYLENIYNYFNIQNNFDYIYIILSIIFSIDAFLWWRRLFSNAYNLNYSLHINIIRVIYISTVSIVLTYIFGMKGLLVSLLVLKIYALYFWLTRLNKYRRII